MATSTASSPRGNVLQSVGGRLLGWVFSAPYPYANSLDWQRAAVISLIGLIFGMMGIVGVAGLMLVLPAYIPQGLLPPSVGMGLLFLLVALLARRGYLRWASLGMVVLTLIVPTVLAVGYGLLGVETLVLSYAVPVVLASFLVAPAWSFSIAGVATLGAAMDVLLPQRGISTPSLSVGQALITLAISAFLLEVLALLSWLISTSVTVWAASAQRRAAQLEAAVVISESAARGPGLSVLLNEVIERIREAYGFYHAQVFLLDEEKRMARLVASTGRAGEELLARGHALPVGSRSVIGQCTLRGEPVVINNVRQSEIHRPNPLLPDTAAELALPLLVAGEVIGALDVQSTTPDAFQPDDVRALQVMAAQLTAAVENARLLDEVKARAAENERLYQEAQANLRQIEELNRRLTRQGWSDYLSTRRTRGTLGYTLQGGAITADATWTAPMRQAYQGEHGVVIRKDGQVHIAALPVRVRGETIGVLEIARGEDRPWSDGEIELAETLVERLALALENARLFEEASLATGREAAINLIAQDVQSAESVDQVLQTALVRLSEVLGVERSVVQISPRAEGTQSAAPAASEQGA